MAISSIEIKDDVAAGAGGAASGGAAGGGAAAVGGGAGSSSVITSRGVGGGGCGSGSFSFGRGVDTGVADGVEEVDAPADRLLFLLRRRFIKRVGRDTTLETFFGERHHGHFQVCTKINPHTFVLPGSPCLTRGTSSTTLVAGIDAAVSLC